MSKLVEFEQTVQKYYSIRTDTCTHSDKNHAVYLQRPADRYEEEHWSKYTVCQKCADFYISVAHCGGCYNNFRLFVDDTDVSDKYNLLSKPVEPIPCLMFHTDIDRGWQVLRITIREKDFCNSNYEKFFYNTMAHMHQILSDKAKSTVEEKFIDSTEHELLKKSIEFLIDTDYGKLWKVTTCLDDTNESVQLNGLSVNGLPAHQLSF